MPDVFKLPKLEPQPNGTITRSFVGAVAISDAAPITSVTVLGGVLTVTMSGSIPSWTQGTLVTLSGLPPAQNFLNGQLFEVLSISSPSSPPSFEFTAPISYGDYPTTLTATGFATTSGGKVVLLGPDGRISTTMVTAGGGGGSSVSVNGFAVTNPDFNGSAPSPGGGYTAVVWTTDGSDVSAWYLASGSSTEIQVNGVDTTAQTPINFESGPGILVTNPSAGNIQFTLSPPMAFSSLAGTATKSQLPATTVYTDQANTFGAFLQKFQAGTDFGLVDPTDTTKVAQFDLSNIAGGQTRTVNIPNANSTTVQASTAPTHQFANSVSAQGVVGYAQPVYGDISGTPQLPITNAGSSHEFFTSYSSITGVFGLGQPSFGDLSDETAGSATISVLEIDATTIKLDATNKDVVIVRDAAGILALKNGSVPQGIRVYQTTSPPTYFSLTTDASGSVIFGVEAGTSKWRIDGSSFGFLATTDNAYDIGAAGANRPRNVYVGTDVITPKLDLTTNAGTVTVAGQAGSATWTLALPTSAGAAGNLLSTDGTGVTSWVSPGSATLPSISAVSTNNDSYTTGQRRTYDLSMAKTFTAWRVTEASTSSSPPTLGKKFRLQLYQTSAARLADASRGFTIPLPLGQPHGCILDLYIPQTGVWVTPFNLTPNVGGSNNDGPPQLVTIYAAVTSVETTTQNISVTISFVAMES